MSILGPISDALFGTDGQDAAQKAADAQTDAGKQAVAESRRQYDLTRQDFAPYREAGTNALAALTARMNGPAPAIPTMAAYGMPTKADYTKGFTADPGYKFRLNQGLDAVNASAAAKGLLGSGATVKALNDYAQGQASQAYGDWYARNAALVDAAYNRRAGLIDTTYGRQYGQYTDSLNRLASVAGVGQTATSQGAALGNQTSNAIANGLTGIGNAQASGYLNAYQAGQNNIANMIKLAGVGASAARGGF
jgi:hypothetical protein